nr:putative ribonuclease H-like domain-containing protein [Tanacetum cinerariifolium]
MLDYGYNFINTKIFIDNESTICIVKNPVFHSKTKHIEIRHHFIRDSNENKLIQMIKFHTNQNVADLLTKAFDVGSTKLMLLGKLTTAIDVNAVEEKPTESKGFEQIIDFLNANHIKYALTVNLMIYTSCIKQFQTMTKIKTVNGEEHIQALVDKKKVIIIETSVRSDLHFADAKDEHVTTTSNDPLSGEDRVKLTELANGIVIQEPGETSTPTLIYSSQQSSKDKDKGKDKMIEPEKPLKRKYQIMIDEEVARNLEAQMQAELEEEERLASQKEEEANIALIG